MKNSLKVLSLCLLMTSTFAYAEGPKNDAETIEEVARFSEESTKVREAHIQEMRELNLKHINELYDRKLAQNKELSELWKQAKPGDKEGNKAIREQIKEKHKAFKKENKQFRDDFMKNVLKKKQHEFHDGMKGRHQKMKSKFKE